MNDSFNDFTMNNLPEGFPGHVDKSTHEDFQLAPDFFKSSDDIYRILFENTRDIILFMDIYGNILEVNNTAVNVYGYSPEEFRNLKISDLRRSDAEDFISGQMRLAYSEGIVFEATHYRKDSTSFYAEVSSRGIILNGVKLLLSTVRDISERKRTEKALREREKQYRSLFLSAPIGIFHTDREGKILMSNPAMSGMLGYSSPEELIASISNIGIQVYEKEEKRKEIMNELLEKIGWVHHEAVWRKKDGSLINVDLTGRKVLDPSGEVFYFESFVSEITERKNAEKQVLHISYHDHLTGLYNRRYYEEEIRRLDTDRNLPIALIMADVNGLKLTNDVFGHKAGDMLLKKIASIFKKECRSDEIIARIGGDEFVFLLTKTDEEKAGKLIGRINNAVSGEREKNIILSVSFGYAIKRNNLESMDEIFKKAEDEMYRHKISESSSMRSQTIDMVMNSLYEKNRKERPHSKNVSEICTAIAEALGLEKSVVGKIRIAGLMHDIGKIGISDHILNKAGKFSATDWHEIMKHPAIGYRMLSSVNEFAEIADYVLEHHERWNGKGYPAGLKEKEISVEARIIAIADTYDALIAESSYKDKLSTEKALEEMKSNSGIEFDPDILKIFIEKVIGKKL